MVVNAFDPGTWKAVVYRYMWVQGYIGYIVNFRPTKITQWDPVVENQRMLDKFNMEQALKMSQYKVN